MRQCKYFLRTDTGRSHFGLAVRKSPDANPADMCLANDHSISIARRKSAEKERTAGSGR